MWHVLNSSKTLFSSFMNLSFLVFKSQSNVVVVVVVVGVVVVIVVVLIFSCPIYALVILRNKVLFQVRLILFLCLFFYSFSQLSHKFLSLPSSRSIAIINLRTSRENLAK